MFNYFKGWVGIGSSFLPVEIMAAFLWVQLDELDKIQARRKEIWDSYYSSLQNWALNQHVNLPAIPDYAPINNYN